MLLIAAFALVAIIAVDGRPWSALGLVGVALAIKPVRTIVGGAQGGALIPVLGGTGKLQLATGLLAAVGIALGG